VVGLDDQKNWNAEVFGHPSSLSETPHRLVTKFDHDKVDLLERRVSDVECFGPLDLAGNEMEAFFE
jgi:hypothetical protein